MSESMDRLRAVAGDEVADAVQRFSSAAGTPVRWN